MHKDPESVSLCIASRCSLSSPKNGLLPVESFLKLPALTISSPLVDTEILIPRSLAFLDSSRVRSQSGGSREEESAMSFTTPGSSRPLWIVISVCNILKWILLIKDTKGFETFFYYLEFETRNFDHLKTSISLKL